jgi:site-specific DNA recombinase
MSLDDQIDHNKQIVRDLYEGPVEHHVIATKGKGERLDRPELVKVQTELRKGYFDLLMFEDLGRMVRGAEAVRLMGIAVDHGTRVIAPNDCIDTAEGTWEEDALAACRDHVGHNAHTSKRLKHKLMNRFEKFGQALPLMIYGYIKPQGAESYDDILKDPSAIPIYQEIFKRLEADPNCSAMADWLQQNDVPTGPYSRRKSWDGKMVRRLVANPLLKGRPGRGFRHSVKHHETGRRISEKNPDGPHYRDHPHLAHVDPVLWDEVNDLLRRNNEGCGRPKINGVDVRRHVPRKRTRFPGQHARCWYCGRQLVWGGNGITGNLMCNGAREYKCWNSIGFDGALAAKKLVDVITSELYAMDGFDEQFRQIVSKAAATIGGDAEQRWKKLKDEEATIAQQKENVASAIAKLGIKPMLEEKIREIEEKERQLLRQRHELESIGRRKPEIPASTAELRKMLEEEFGRLAIDSPEFGNLMRRLVPQFDVYLVRLCDGGHLVARGEGNAGLGRHVRRYRTRARAA